DVVDPGSQVHPWPRAVALEPHAAAHIGGIVGALYAQRRRAHLPAGALAPADQVAGQAQIVRHAEAGGPIETHLMIGLQLQRYRLGIAIKTPTQATQAGALADGVEAGIQEFTFGAQRATGIAFSAREVCLSMAGTFLPSARRIASLLP